MTLRDLANVGAATAEDLRVLGITSVAQLATCEADELYTRLRAVTGEEHDPCCWDVFAAAIHQAKTGEATKWWDWTPVRKERQAAGEFPDTGRSAR
jgi:nucleotidyltransferase/DNA polymerase involved in DNA repair